MKVRRIFHHWKTWECHKAGFYKTSADYNIEESKALYAEFLGNIPRFECALERVLEEWPNSCEQFLSNDNINRVAWLGQASMCIETGTPSCFRGGFFLLSLAAQDRANKTAERYLTKWLIDHEENDFEESMEL